MQLSRPSAGWRVQLSRPSACLARMESRMVSSLAPHKMGMVAPPIIHREFEASLRLLGNREKQRVCVCAINTQQGLAL